MKFSFLVYVERSGSTLFARELANEAKDIVVLPEFNLLELMIAETDESIRQMSQASLMKMLRQDHQRANLGFTDEEWGKLLAIGQGGGIRGIAEAIVAEYAARIGRDPGVAMLKRGRIMALKASVLSVFPEAQFIHMFRDVRAVVNSAIRTESPYGRSKMVRGDPVFVAAYWSRFVAEMQRLDRSAEVPLMHIRYEELCRDAGGVVPEVIEWLGGKRVCQARRPGTEFEVTGVESGIHRMIKQPLTGQRSQAWKTELRTREGVVVELIAGRQLRNAGYDTWFLRRSAKPIVLAAAFWGGGVHVAKTVRHYTRRLTFYIRDRERIITKVKMIKAKRKRKPN